MKQMRDWQSNREMWIRVLAKQTGQGLAYWNQRVREQAIADQDSLRTWLKSNGVTGYAENLLVMEYFGYPDFVVTPADELLANQYADRPQLRPIYDGIIEAVAVMGPFTIQMRKTYASLLTSRRTFARIKPSSKHRLDIGLRLAGQEPAGRLLPCRLQATMRVQLSLTGLEELDEEAVGWIRKAYDENL